MTFKEQSIKMLKTQFTLLSLLLFLFSISLSKSVVAIENYSGTYKGFEDVNNVCPNPANNTFFSDFTVVTIVQNGNEVSGTSVNAFLTATFSGTVDESGNFTSTYTTSDGDAGTATGSVSDTTQSFQLILQPLVLMVV
jgi:hypothetical protein